MKLQELFDKAGFGEGVYQYFPISSADIETVIGHEYCRGGSITGSTDAGAVFAQV
jgi:acyl-CoA reductase-like NAD-dependent aldehyde dehydrogenase